MQCIATRDDSTGNHGRARPDNRVLKKIVFLAYHLPPIGGAAVQRNVRLMRYLAEAGFEPVVVTGRGSSRTRWTPADETLESDIPPETAVYRLQGEERVVPPGRWRGRGERWLGLEKNWTRWWTRSVIDLADQLRSHDVSLVYAPLVPFESLEAAQHLSRLLRKPLVIDLHDPWALDEMIVYPSAIHRRAARRSMSRALRTADGVIANTPEAHRRLVSAFPFLASKPVAVVPNGFDQRDFRGPPSPGDEHLFRIAHTGYLHTQLGRRQRRLRPLDSLLRGTIAGADVVTRSHIFVVRAIDELLMREPALGPVELCLAGVTTADDHEAASAFEHVRFLGYLPHARSVDLIRSADLLFLPMHNVSPGYRAGIMPGKTFEYLAAGRPILAAVPEGDVKDLLAAAGNAYLCAPDDTGAMAEAIADGIRRKRAGQELPPPPDELIAPFEWRALAGRLATLFERVLASVTGDGPL